jgi:hypothetical protein
METAKRTILEGNNLTSPFAPRNKAADILSEESATAQVLDLLEYYDINVMRIPVEERGKVESALQQLVGYVRRGSVEVSRDKDQKISVTVNLSDGGTAIEFKEIGARHKLVMDRVKDGGTYSRIYALMGSLCGLGTGAIEKLQARDLAVVEILGMVFLAA